MKTAKSGGGREAVSGCHIVYAHIHLTRDITFIAVSGTSFQKWENEKTLWDLDFSLPFEQVFAIQMKQPVKQY